MPYNSTIPGFMSIEELQTLEAWAAAVPPCGIIVEIGSFMGRSAWALAKSSHPTVTLYCIDPWPRYHISKTMQKVMDSYEPNIPYTFERFRENMHDCPNLIPIKGASTEVEWPQYKQVDLVFIDAKHKSPHIESDLACWLPRLKKGGILAGHDYLPDRYPDVCRAVDSLSQKLDLPVNNYKGGSLWTIKLNSDKE